MGMYVSNVPADFPRRKPGRSDIEWLLEDVEELTEMKLPQEFLDVIMRGIEEPLRKNQELPDNTFYNREGSEFIIGR